MEEFYHDQHLTLIFNKIKHSTRLVCTLEPALAQIQFTLPLQKYINKLRLREQIM
jgi:hypothetical protein